MALVVKDRVRETSTTTGTGTLTLNGAVGGFQSFSVIGNANTTYYTIVDAATGAWEVGIGTYTASGTLLSRTTVLESSNSGSLVNFAAGTKDVFCTYPAEKAVLLDENNGLFPANDLPAIISVNTATNALRITQVGTGNALLVEDSANPDATPVVIDNSGYLVVGHTGRLTTTNTGQIQSVVTSAGNAFNAVRFSSTTGGSEFNFAKSDSDTIGTNTVVANNDTIGNISFSGADGTNYIRAAQIFAAVDGTPGTNDMPGRLVFSTTADGASSPTERMRIRSDGGIGVGGAGNAAISLYLQKDITGAGTSYSFRQAQTINSDVTSSVFVNRTDIATQAAAFTLVNLRHYFANQGAIGAGSSITNQYGFVAESTLTGATNNYGFYSNIASGTGRWNFYANGTADNYFAGNVGVGTTTPAARLHVFGTTKIGGILVEDSNTSTAAPAIEVIGKRSDANNFPAFAGKLLLARNRTDAAIASNITLGALAFGGNHTDGTLANILYSASIVGLSSGTFSSATAMPTSLVFYTGDVGRAPDTAGVTIGTERMRISETGTISLGAAPGSESLRVTPVASAVNYIEVQGATTGSVPIFRATGSDTNVPLTILTKGTGYFNFQSGGGTQFFVGNTASAVNYLQVTGGATGSAPSIIAQGSDTNINLKLSSKGGAGVELNPGNQGTPSLVAAYVASPVNYAAVYGSATGNAIQFNALGSDTNIDITLTPKGTGVVRDASGNIRAVPKSGATKTTSYSLTTADVGDFIEIGTGGSITIPNATFATGDIVSLFNNTSGNITVTCSITTAYIGGTDTDKATVTLATRGVATILFVSGTVCVINGNVT